MDDREDRPDDGADTDPGSGAGDGDARTTTAADGHSGESPGEAGDDARAAAGDDLAGAPQVAGAELIAAAREVQERAYVPYSEYPVGAALRCGDGSVYVGCNLENANYSNSLHAEEVAVARALMEGHREFDRIAVSSGERDGVTPCGMCRQTLAEFCDADLAVLCDLGDSVREYTLGELLPEAISASTLGKGAGDGTDTDAGDGGGTDDGADGGDGADADGVDGDRSGN